MKVTLQAEMFWKPLTEICLMTNSQYVTDDVWLRIAGDQENPFTLLPSEAFHTRYDFEVATSVTSDPNEEAAQLQTGLQYLQLVSQAEPERVKWDKFFEDMGRSIFGRKVRKFTRSDEELVALQQQKVFAEQTANAEAGANAPQPNAGPLTTNQS
jgi:hypothetical protein